MKVLFVCLGNICRSPAAEGFCRAAFARAGLTGHEVASRGIGGWHAGDLPDHRMRQAALRRGVTLASRAQKLTVGDVECFDAVYCMDGSNLADALRLAGGSPPLRAKIRSFAKELLARSPAVGEIPDPYEQGPECFELVLDLVEEGCDRLVQKVQAGDL